MSKVRAFLLPQILMTDIKKHIDCKYNTFIRYAQNLKKIKSHTFFYDHSNIKLWQRLIFKQLIKISTQTIFNFVIIQKILIAETWNIALV